GAAVVSGLLLVPLGVFGGPALAHTGASSAAQYEYKVTICHHTGSSKHPWHLITISNRAVPAHLRHHDVLPPCPKPPATPVTHGKSSESHGNQSSTGQSQAASSSQKGNDDDNDGHGKGQTNGHHGKP